MALSEYELTLRIACEEGMISELEEQIKNTKIHYEKRERFKEELKKAKNRLYKYRKLHNKIIEKEIT